MPIVVVAGTPLILGASLVLLDEIDLQIECSPVKIAKIIVIIRGGGGGGHSAMGTCGVLVRSVSYR